MNDARRTKLEAQLAAAEAELRARLIACLPAAADRSWTLFVNSAVPHGMPVRYHDGEDLLTAARACLDLRERLALPRERSPAQLYLDVCAESASDDEHRRGPRRLAQWLLRELTADDAAP